MLPPKGKSIKQKSTVYNKNNLVAPFRTRVDHANYALEHVLSYQRRFAMTKESFMRPGEKTPADIFSD